VKTAGITGGTGPKSTIEYYRLIVASYREHKRDGSYPQVIINSIDLKKMLDLKRLPNHRVQTTLLRKAADAER